MHSLRNLLLLPLLVSFALTGCFGGSSSPTGPSGGPTPPTTPTGTVNVGGGSAFGTQFQPDLADLAEIGVARTVMFVENDEKMMLVAFNVVNFMVTQVLLADDDGNEWGVFTSIAEQVPGASVTADGDDWIITFSGVSLPEVSGAEPNVVLSGSLSTRL